MPYLEHRALRIKAAEQYEGWSRPPYPFQTAIGRCIGRVVMAVFKYKIGNAVVTLQPGLYRFTDEIESIYKAKEKMQNRVQFGP